MSLTAGQINTFVLMARRKLVDKGSFAIDLVNIGDKTFDENKKIVNLTYAMLSAVEGYDPEAENNCLTEIQIRDLIEFIDLKLDVAADFDNLPET